MKTEFQKVGNQSKRFTETADFLCARPSDTKRSVESPGGRVKELEVENRKLRSDATASQRSNNDTKGPSETISKSERQLEDIKPTNFPEVAAESVLPLVTAAAGEPGASLDARDAVSAVRLGRERCGRCRRGPAAAEAGPIVARLARRALRGELLRAAASPPTDWVYKTVGLGDSTSTRDSLK